MATKALPLSYYHFSKLCSWNLFLCFNFINNDLFLSYFPLKVHLNKQFRAIPRTCLMKIVLSISFYIQISAKLCSNKTELLFGIQSDRNLKLKFVQSSQISWISTRFFRNTTKAGISAVTVLWKMPIYWYYVDLTL